MDYDIADIGLADDGEQRIAWAARRMPVLASLRARYEQSRPFEGVRFARITTMVASLTAP